MLSFQTIEPDTLELLKALMAEPSFNGMRLVGGTSLALQYGHRQSVDIDMFGIFSPDASAMSERLKKLGQTFVVKESERIKIYTINGIKVDFVDYGNYPWIDDVIIENGLRLASPKDIAAMKINAIEGRGTKKDFIDVYFLLQHYSLNQLLDFYAKKYPEHSIFRALRRQYAAYAENVFRYYLEQNQRKDNVGSKKI
jgi:predicted nucleotidyltransferase component of viral defense system